MANANQQTGSGTIDMPGTKLQLAQTRASNALNKVAPDNQRLAALPTASSTQFYSDLDVVLKRSTAENIQKCKDWIMRNIAPSKSRLSVLGTYLVALSQSVVADKISSQKQKSLVCWRILLVVNDVLHADKYHRQDFAILSSGGSDPSHTTEATHSLSHTSLSHSTNQDFSDGLVGDALASNILDLTKRTAFQLPKAGSAVETQLKGLLDFWANTQVLKPHHITAIQESAQMALDQAQGRKGVYTLPSLFGYKHARWYDLPASYMLEPMIQYPDRAIEPRYLRPLSFNRSEPSRYVCDLLDDYFENIGLQYRPTSENPTGQTDKYRLWLDPMGQMVKQSKETGERTTVCNAWGWSMKMCEDMRKSDAPETIIKQRAEAIIQRQEIPQQQRQSRGQNRYESKRRNSYSRQEDLYDTKRRKSSSSQSGPDYNRSSRPSSSSSFDRPPTQQHRRSRDRGREFDYRRRNSGLQSGDDMDVYPPRAKSGRFNQDSARPDRNSFNAPPPGPPSGPSGFRPNMPNPSASYGPGNPQPPPPPPRAGMNFQPPYPPPLPPSGPVPGHFPGQFPGQSVMQQFPPPPPQPFHFQPSHPSLPQFNGPSGGYGSNNNGLGSNQFDPTNGYGNSNFYAQPVFTPQGYNGSFANSYNSNPGPGANNMNNNGGYGGQSRGGYSGRGYRGRGGGGGGYRGNRGQGGQRGQGDPSWH